MKDRPYQKKCVTRRKGGPRMPTFKFNSEQPYYQSGRLVKKVKTQHNLNVSSRRLRNLGLDCGAFAGQADTGPDFQTQSVPTALTFRHKGTRDGI